MGWWARELWVAQLIRSVGRRMEGQPVGAYGGGCALDVAPSREIDDGPMLGDRGAAGERGESNALHAPQQRRDLVEDEGQPPVRRQLDEDPVEGVVGGDGG